MLVQLRSTPTVPVTAVVPAVTKLPVPARLPAEKLALPFTTRLPAPCTVPLLIDRPSIALEAADRVSTSEPSRTVVIAVTFRGALSVTLPPLANTRLPLPVMPSEAALNVTPAEKATSLEAPADLNEKWSSAVFASRFVVLSMRTWPLVVDRLMF